MGSEMCIRDRGQNVRLASKLVGWKIDVKSESKYSKSIKEGYLSLLRIPGVGEITANLLQGHYTSAREVAETTVTDLVQTTGLSDRKATALIEAARDMLQGSPPEDETETIPAGSEIHKG